VQRHHAQYILRNHLEKGLLQIPDAKFSAFKVFPTPATSNRTKSFVWAMSNYQQFIP
jgi:hypothetical protein